MRSRLLTHRLLLPLAAIIAAAIAGCGGAGPDWPNKSPKVVASFPPLYCFALNVAGDDAAVKTAMTAEGPHHFDPKASDARLLRRADLFFINGLGLDEGPAEKMRNGSGNPRLTVVNLGERIDPKELEENCNCHHDHAGQHVHDHAVDPHVWLGLDLAVKQVEGIRDGLKAADPAHADGYGRRAADYAARLRKLEADGKAMLAGKKDRKFVSFHGSLAYFARAFDLDVAEVIEKVPGQEPTGEELKAIVEACKENGVRVIAVEPQYTSQSAAKRILDELRRKGVPDPALVEIDPLETAREQDLSAGWYEAKMRANLEALAGALK